ncbi:hypothetical protein ACLOJK_027509, partial [Asimina triloba]
MAPSNFFFKPILPSNLAEPICSIDGDNRLPPVPIRPVHLLADIDPTLLPLILTTSACIAFHLRSPAPLPSLTASTANHVDRQSRRPPARCRPPSLSASPARSIPSMSTRLASVWHDHSNVTPTIDVCIDDAAFAI